MALTILVTPAAGDIIQSSVWINEFNNIYNNPISLISPLTATLNLNGQTLSGAATFSGAITFSNAIALGTPASGVATNLTSIPAANLLIASQAIGDILYASSATAWTRLADVATGSVLTSGGITTAPVYSAAPTLTTSLTTPLVIGGTGTTSPLTLKTTTGIGTTNADMIFQVGNNGATEAMRILNSGVIGIRNASPTWNIAASTGLVDIGGSANVVFVLHSSASTQEVSMASDGAGLYFRVNGHATAAGNNTINFATEETNSQNTPTTRLTISSAGIHTMSAYGVGTATFDANGVISSVSDERFKSIIGPYTVGLAEILKINPILFNWNKDEDVGVNRDTENIYAGFSAQNVMEWIPEAVGKNLKGMYSLNDRTILAALVNAVKSLHTEVGELRTKAGLSLKPYIATKVLDEKRLIVSHPVPKKEV